jgi:sarcosine oxidase subunit beta
VPAQVTYLDELPATAAVVVVGGGVAGAATAFHTASAGLDTVLLEARGQLAAMTTAVATGGYRLQFERALELAEMRESMELLENFAERTGQRTYTPQLLPRGYLWVTADERQADRQRTLVELQRSFGLDGVELLDQAELRRRFGYLDGKALQARFRAADGFLSPRQVTLGLAAGSGARVVCDCRVTGFRLASSRLRGVLTDRGTIDAGAVVIACGPLSGAVAAMAGVTLPVTAVRRHKLVCPDLPGLPADAPMTIDEDSGTHWRPYLGGAAMLWNDPDEPAGVPAECVVADPGFAPAVLDPRRPSAAARLTPLMAAAWRSGARFWVEAGQYTMTPDQLPLVGPTELEGLHVNTGYCGHGVMMSPGASRRLADAIRGADPGPFDPRRPMHARAGGRI